MSNMTPREIVHDLDKHIIGQDDAKRAVAIALRNRWRRMQLPEELRTEISPKNILMIGPTGVGKTEIARRLAKLAGAPFIKVEATKFTEVGYVGRDVESIIRDLAEAAVKMLRDEQIKRAEPRAFEAAEDRVLEALLPSARDADSDENSSTRQLFRKKLREGELDDKEVEMEVQATAIGVEIMAPPGMEEMTSQLQNMFSSMAPGKNKSKKMNVKLFDGVLHKEDILEKICVQYDVSPSEIAYIGDDVNDIDLLKLVGLGVVPKDGNPIAKKSSNYISKTIGGKGVFREIAELILLSKKIPIQY